MFQLRKGLLVLVEAIRIALGWLLILVALGTLCAMVVGMFIGVLPSIAVICDFTIIVAIAIAVTALVAVIIAGLEIILDKVFG